MYSLLIETFKPWCLLAVMLTQWACVLVGVLFLICAVAIGSILGAEESLVFLVAAVVLTGIKRVISRW